MVLSSRLTTSSQQQLRVGVLDVADHAPLMQRREEVDACLEPLQYHAVRLDRRLAVERTEPVLLELPSQSRRVAQVRLLPIRLAQGDARLLGFKCLAKSDDLRRTVSSFV